MNKRFIEFKDLKDILLFSDELRRENWNHGTPELVVVINTT